MDDIKKIIETSTFETQPGKFVYAKARNAPAAGKHFLVAKDRDEVTVVTREESLAGLDVIEKNKDDWALIALNVSAPFYSVGFLATVTSAIAKQGMNALVVSTYSKDYVLVRHDLLGKAEKTLLELGFKRA
jgi:hypothetical protein